MEYRTVEYANGNIDIYLWRNHDWIPWLYVRPSRLLESLGVWGRGVYAARSFPVNTVLGRYSGYILGRSSDVGDWSPYMIDVRGWALDTERPLQSDEEQQALFSQTVFREDLHPYPGMHAHLINDPHGTNRQPNCVASWGGIVSTTRRVPRCVFDAVGRPSAESELLIEYGSRYWKQHARVFPRQPNKGMVPSSMYALPRLRPPLRQKQKPRRV